MIPGLMMQGGGTGGDRAKAAVTWPLLILIQEYIMYKEIAIAPADDTQCSGIARTAKLICHKSTRR